MPGDKPRLARKPRVLFLGLSLVVAMAMVILFSLQKTMLNRQFDSLVSGYLDAHVQNRVADIATDIANTRSILGAAAGLIQGTGLSPKEDCFKKILDQLGIIDSAESISYIALEDLQTSALAGSYQRLARGETVATDILYSEYPPGYYYYICVPIWESGKITGVISARMRAEDLVRVEPDGVIYKGVRTCLVNSKGKLIFVDPNTPPTGDIFMGMREQGVPEADIAGVADILRGQQAHRFQFTRKGDTYFVSVGEIGYNDWHLVTFLRGPDVLVRSDRILKSATNTGAILVLVTIGACFVIYSMLLSDRKKLELEQRRYAMLAQFSDTILFEYNRGTDSVEFTSNALAHLRLKRESIENLSGPDHAEGLFHPDDQDKVQEIFYEPKEPGIVYYAELRIKCQNGQYLWYGCQYRTLEDAEQGVSLVVGKLVDITNQRSREQQLEEKARRDILTGTYNKAGVEMIDELLKGRPHGVLIMMDIDDFKLINDTYGHSAGDAVLAQLGRMLNEVFRKDDVVARVGGDEFVIFLPGLQDPGMVRDRVEHLLSLMRAISVGDGAMTVSASAGIAIAPQDGVAFQELYAVADRAMYVAKEKQQLAAEL